MITIVEARRVYDLAIVAQHQAIEETTAALDAAWTAQLVESKANKAVHSAFEELVQVIVRERAA